MPFDSIEQIKLPGGMHVPRVSFDWFFAVMGDTNDWCRKNKPDAYQISAISDELQVELPRYIRPATLVLLWTEFEPLVVEKAHPATLSAVRAAMGRLMPLLIDQCHANMDDAKRARAAEIEREYRLAHGL